MIRGDLTEGIKRPCGDLSDDQWRKIEPFVRGGRRGKRGPRSDNRSFVNALIWMARSGAPWRDLPERYGKYQTIKRRYYRWVADGVLERLFEALAAEADTEWVSVDSTTMKAHPQAAGAPRKKGALRPTALAALAAG